MSHRQGPGPSVDRPYFFFSYARIPKLDPSDPNDPDRFVHKLYKDLSHAILNLSATHSAGFMDREIRPGVQWPNELAGALATCRVFVPLYSPRYFESDSCGREWFAFARRWVNHNARGTPAGPAIVPALWVTVKPDSMPEVARLVQFNHQDLGTRYSIDGFFGIVGISKFRSDYQMAVKQLARRIVDVANQTEIRAEKPLDFMSLESAFRPGGLPRTASRRVQITVVAPDKSSLAPGRNPDYYGDTPEDWSPYRPDCPQPIARYAAELLASCLGCKPTVSTLDDRTAGLTAAGQIAPRLLLVDAWAAQSAEHQQRLRQLDALDQSYVSVMVPWSRQDAETAAGEVSLRLALRQSLGRMLASVPHGCEPAADGIPTLQEFGDLLPRMVMAILQKYLKQAPAYPPAGPAIERPRISISDPEDDGGQR